MQQARDTAAVLPMSEDPAQVLINGTWKPTLRLLTAMDEAIRAQFGAPVGFVGQGGTPPLMNLLQQGFPAAKMMVCGVLGPKSNAHGPGEFLHIDYGKRLTASMAQVIAAHP